MIKIKKLFIFFLTIYFFNYTQKKIPRTIFIPLSQGARLYLQYHDYSRINENSLLTFNGAFLHQSLFSQQSISEFFFGKNYLEFQGHYSSSGESINHKIDKLVPDNFGFGPDSDFTITLNNSSLKSTIFNFNFEFNGCGYWASITLPFVSHSQRMSTSCADCNQNDVLKGFYGVMELDTSGKALVTTPDSNDGGKAYLLGKSHEEAQSASDIINYFLKEANLDVAYEYEDELANQFIPINFYGKTRISIRETEESLPANYYRDLNNQFVFLYSDKGINEELCVRVDPIKCSPNVFEGLKGYCFGDLKKRLYNKIDNDDFSCNNRANGIADIHTQIGYTLCAFDENSGGLGVYLKSVFPCGTLLDKSFFEYAFSPIIGNGGHWELGGGILLQKNIFLNECKKINFIFSSYVTHLFSTSQFRSFDDNDKPLSRYALVKELLFVDNLESNDYDDSYLYAHDMYALGDINAFFCRSSHDLFLELFTHCSAQINNYCLGFSYNFIYRSKEKLCIKNNDIKTEYDKKTFYGYKGDGENDIIMFYMDTPNDENVKNFCLDGSCQGKGSDIKMRTSSSIVKKSAGGAYNYGDEFTDRSPSDHTLESDLIGLPAINKSGIMPATSDHAIFFDFKYLFDEDYHLLPFFDFWYGFHINNIDFLSLVSWETGFKLGIMY